MKTIKIACLLGLLLSLAAASDFVPSALTHSSPGVFGYTDIGTAYEIDTGAGLVFQVRKTDGSIISIVFNGTEYKCQAIEESDLALRGSGSLGPLPLVKQLRQASFRLPIFVVDLNEFRNIARDLRLGHFV